mgnify:CR=1 FL=1
MNVLVKDVEFNPLKGQVDEIDFQALVSNEKVHSVSRDRSGRTMRKMQAVYWSSYWKKYSSRHIRQHWLTR